MLQKMEREHIEEGMYAYYEYGADNDPGTYIFALVRIDKKKVEGVYYARIAKLIHKGSLVTFVEGGYCEVLADCLYSTMIRKFNHRLPYEGRFMVKTSDPHGGNLQEKEGKIDLNFGLLCVGSLENNSLLHCAKVAAVLDNKGTVIWFNEIMAQGGVQSF